MFSYLRAAVLKFLKNAVPFYLSLRIFIRSARKVLEYEFEQQRFYSIK